jgi:DNA-binding beta-propeller fold protein YncE
MNKNWIFFKKLGGLLLLILFGCLVFLTINFYLKSIEPKELFLTSKPDFVNINLWQGNAVNLSLNSRNNKGIIDTPVSITNFKDDAYFIANYGQIYLFSPKNGQFDEMQPIISQGKTYIPTGVFFSSKHNALFVANYQGNNILVFDVDSKAKKLSLRSEIKTNNTIGPENVFVSPDGQYLASANYDGSTVTCFSFSSGEWREIWATKIANAHGVAIVDNFVYATALGEAALVELDLQKGSIIRRTGQLGWNPLKAGFLWPTAVYPLSDKQLIVSDAQTGFISILDRRNLKVVKYFGGNGSTYKYFNMPYATIVHKNILIVASTYQNRIAFIDLGGSNKVENYIFNNTDWNYLFKNTKIVDSIKMFGIGWKEYVWKDGPKVELFNQNYLLGYSSLMPEKEKGVPQLLFPAIGSAFTKFLSSYFYFIDYIALNRGKLFFSPQAEPALYIEERNGIYYLVPIVLGVDSWRVGEEIINSKGKVSLVKLSQEVNRIVTYLDSVRDENKLIKLDEFCKILFNELCKPKAKIESVFSSDAAKSWLKTYYKCQRQSCKRAEIEEVSNAYFSKAMKEPQIHLDEIISIYMLSGYGGSIK